MSSWRGLWWIGLRSRYKWYGGSKNGLNLSSLGSIFHVSYCCGHQFHTALTGFMQVPLAAPYVNPCLMLLASCLEKSLAPQPEYLPGYCMSNQKWELTATGPYLISWVWELRDKYSLLAPVRLDSSEVHFIRLHKFPVGFSDSHL